MGIRAYEADFDLKGVVKNFLKFENLSSDPGTPAEGQLWYNSTDNYLRYYDGTSTIDIGSGVTGDVLTYKGVIDASTNPNYPAGDAGDTYVISVAGRVGGASGPVVQAGDRLLCLTDSTASGNHTTVGANWNIVNANIASFNVVGTLDASTNPNYPAANNGDIYHFTVAGKVGGASGPDVEVGDLAICITDGSAAGDHATVGGNWLLVNTNVVDASETVKGVVELATNAEVTTGTDTTRAVTPAGLANALSSYAGVYRGTITAASSGTITAATHGLGVGKHLAQIYDGVNQVDAEIDIAANGDVSWSTISTITGSIIVIG